MTSFCLPSISSRWTKGFNPEAHCSRSGALSTFIFSLYHFLTWLCPLCHMRLLDISVLNHLRPTIEFSLVISRRRPVNPGWHQGLSFEFGDCLTKKTVDEWSGGFNASFSRFRNMMRTLKYASLDIPVYSVRWKEGEATCRIYPNRYRSGPFKDRRATLSAVYRSVGHKVKTRVRVFWEEKQKRADSNRLESGSDGIKIAVPPDTDRPELGVDMRQWMDQAFS